MILQALTAYYWRKQNDPDPANRLPAFGFEEKEIPFVIEIDTGGRLVNLVDTRSGNGKKKVGQRFLVPQGVKKTSGIVANLLWDTAEYVLGIDIRGNAVRVAEQNAAFCARIEALPDTAKADAGVRAVLAFLAAKPLGQLAEMPAWPDILSTNPFLTFRLHGDLELICQRPAVMAAVPAEGDGDVASGTCLVTGERDHIERLHPAIKGVWGTQTSGANIVSFNLDAFNSYGKTQGHNAPVGKRAAFAYTTALNHLLKRESSQRIQVGDATTVFWAEQTHELENLFGDVLRDKFGDVLRDNPDRGTDAVRALYTAVHKGRFSRGDAGTRFHVLGLAPNAARIAIRFWETATALELAQRIQQHFEDIRIVYAHYEPEHLSLYRLLTSVAVLNKADNIPPNLGGALMRSILTGLPYPAPLLTLAVQRCRAEQRPTYARAAAIKGSLNRLIRFRQSTEREYSPMLDPSHPSPAYRLGRLFAVLEKIQEEANPNINATIRDRYYGAASSTPVAVFTTLLRLKNHHLGKLSPGRAVQMEKLIAEIMAGLDDIPRQLALHDQGRFALGYYHQRQALFTKTEAHAIDSEKTQ